MAAASPLRRGTAAATAACPALPAPRATPHAACARAAAQVRFHERWRCPPQPLSAVSHALAFTTQHKFTLKLSPQQAEQLCAAFLDAARRGVEVAGREEARAGERRAARSDSREPGAASGGARLRVSRSPPREAARGRSLRSEDAAGAPSPRAERSKRRAETDLRGLLSGAKRCGGGDGGTQHAAPAAAAAEPEAAAPPAQAQAGRVVLRTTPLVVRFERSAARLPAPAPAPAAAPPRAPAAAPPPAALPPLLPSAAPDFLPLPPPSPPRATQALARRPQGSIFPLTLMGGAGGPARAAPPPAECAALPDTRHREAMLREALPPVRVRGVRACLRACGCAARAWPLRITAAPRAGAGRGGCHPPAAAGRRGARARHAPPAGALPPVARRRGNRLQPRAGLVRARCWLPPCRRRRVRALTAPSARASCARRLFTELTKEITCSLSGGGCA